MENFQTQCFITFPVVSEGSAQFFQRHEFPFEHKITDSFQRVGRRRQTGMQNHRIVVNGPIRKRVAGDFQTVLDRSRKDRARINFM
ncbi:hypothetical protein SDC9_148106 [bioreactor metagenome]|uniref:Uncharacterized protein n=1 Tax=bioreactor metagenome TaxID=1076179 RepID=A0A645EFY4_9ZZZZ